MMLAAEAHGEGEQADRHADSDTGGRTARAATAKTTEEAFDNRGVRRAF